MKRLRVDAVIGAACEAVAVTVAEAQELRRRHPEFALEWDQAISSAVDQLERAAWAVALGTVDDVTEATPATSADEPRPRKSKYNANLLQFLLRAHRPELYGGHVRTGRRDHERTIEEDPDPPLLDRGRGD